jgi:hypothetical protein
MKKYLHTSALAIVSFFLVTATNAQVSLAPDQNPSFAVSRDKYMQIADSMNQWHGTTFQETYKAFDWYENKLERRDERRQFRQQLRLERYRYDYNPYYHSGYNYNYRYNPHRYNRFGFCWF